MSSRVMLLSVSGPAEPAIASVFEGGTGELSVVGDPRTAARDAPAHQLVIVDGADDKAAVNLCRDLRRAVDATGAARPPLLAIAHTDDVEQRVRLLEAGADDVLVHPFDPRELEAMVDALLLSVAPARPSTEQAAGETAPAAAAGAGRGQAFVFVAAKGGVGSTTLAVNTALALAETLGSGVALADLDFHHGQVATLLDVLAPATTADLARDEQSLEDAQVIRHAGVAHPGGVHVFAAPGRPDLAAAVDHEQAVSLLQALRRVFPIVVIDAGSVLDWRSLALMDAADRVVVTVTPEIPSLRVLHGVLEVMNEAEGLTQRALFVLNNIFARQTVTAEQIQEHLSVPIALEVPYDSELYLTAANEGQPVLQAAPRSAPAQAVRQLAALLRGEGAYQQAAQPAKRKGLGGLLKRG